jgi:tRNA (guanine37-N1)-methyltransferase
MVVMDAVTRLIPGVLGGSDSAARDSFAGSLLEHAHYTRPETFGGEPVPEVLLSGHHREIERWRLESALIRTFLKRPDLLKERILAEPELEILKKWCRDIEAIIRAQSLRGAESLPGHQ